ncbi:MULTISPECIES: asparaginase [unclassified Moraxella]|uniref:asparaginase n=1 Tax=unclassified Moraxella TaxID=2685852 RepID=UPI003AF74814
MKISKYSMILPLMMATSAFALPNLNIYATGGTIAGTSASNTDTTRYSVAKLNVDKLIEGVPELKTIANVKGYQVASVDSNDMSNEILLKLAKQLNSDLAGDTAGAVITHGTDTLEETAFFLSLTTKPTKPIVLVGSMRPSTSLSADGYMNLLQSASVATHADAKNRGVMVVMNDRIGSGYYITKTNANTPDTFKSVEAGGYGQMIGLTPKFYYAPQVITNKSSFDVSKFDSLPKVEIIYGYQSTDTSQLDSAIANGAKGVVIAGTGAGSLSVPMIARVKELTAKGFPIVRSTRVENGYVDVPEDEGISSGFLNPQKSRVLLTLALVNKDGLPTIRQRFK